MLSRCLLFIGTGAFLQKLQEWTRRGKSRALEYQCMDLREGFRGKNGKRFCKRPHFFRIFFSEPFPYWCWDCIHKKIKDYLLEALRTNSPVKNVNDRFPIFNAVGSQCKGSVKIDRAWEQGWREERGSHNMLFQMTHNFSLWGNGSANDNANNTYSCFPHHHPNVPPSSWMCTTTVVVERHIRECFGGITRHMMTWHVQDKNNK